MPTKTVFFRPGSQHTAIDQGHVAAMALLDLSSAFDTVDHGTLLTILKSSFSVTNQSLAWFHSYLTYRTHIFSTHSSETSPFLFTHGVPQGSGLRPLKFIAYTSDIPNIFTSHNVQYHLFTITVPYLKSPYWFFG